MNNSYEKTTLPNGLRVIKVHMPSVHSVAAGMYVKSGPRFERTGESGISHFLEHMIFKGTNRFPDSRAISEAVDNIAADINGSTLPEFSEFTLIVHPSHFEEGLHIFGNLLTDSTFEISEIENEKRIVAEEISQYRDVAGDSVNLDELAYNLMWPTKERGYSALGSDRTIRAFTRDDIAEHFKKYYVPSNMVLSIAGNFAPERVDPLVEEIFGEMRGDVRFEKPEYINHNRYPRMFYRRMPTLMGYMKLCHAACSYRDSDLMAVLAVCDILGGGTASRLFSTLREEEGLVYDVTAGAALYSDVGSIDIITSANRAKLVPTLNGIMKQIQILREEGCGEREIERVKDRVACQMDFLMDTPTDIIEWFGVRELLTDPVKLETPADELERLRNVTVDEANRVIHEYLVPQRRALVLVGASSWLQRRQIARLLETP